MKILLNAFLEFFQAPGLVALLIKGVEGKTTRNHPIARGGRTIGKCATDIAALQLALFQRVAGQIGIGQHHPPKPDKIDHPLAHQGLSHVGQILL